LLHIPQLNFPVQVEAEAELLAARHVGDVNLLRWDIRGTQFLGESFPGGVIAQEQWCQVVEGQEKSEDRKDAERG